GSSARRPRGTARSARLSDSVPPEVIRTQLRGTSSSAAILTRDSSSTARARRPEVCTDEGFPRTAAASRKASRAAGRSTVVATWSRYARGSCSGVLTASPARLVPSSAPSRRSPRLDRVVLGLAGVLLAVAALRVAVALLELVVLLLLLGAALGGGLLVGPVALGVLAGRIPGVLLPGGPALVLAAGVGIVPGLLVGLAALLLDPLAVVLGGLGVLVAGAATALAL